MYQSKHHEDGNYLRASAAFTFSMGMPNSSATTWQTLVWRPCPISVPPWLTRTVPSRYTCTSAPPWFKKPAVKLARRTYVEAKRRKREKERYLVGEGMWAAKCERERGTALRARLEAASMHDRARARRYDLGLVCGVGAERAEPNHKRQTAYWLLLCLANQTAESKRKRFKRTHKRAWFARKGCTPSQVRVTGNESRFFGGSGPYKNNSGLSPVATNSENQGPKCPKTSAATFA